MIAMGFVRNGAKTYIVSRKDTSAFAAEVQERAGAGGQCIALQADLGTNVGVAQLAHELDRLEPGGVDVLVNNSGTNWAAALSDYGPSQWDKVYALNVRGVFDLTRLLVPSLERASRRSGQPSRVINISSIGTSSFSRFFVTWRRELTYRHGPTWALPHVVPPCRRREADPESRDVCLQQRQGRG
jgi:NAD(P)-dependent dehydrogenase (short-subunit alcohol dehydrogenase family)